MQSCARMNGQYRQVGAPTQSSQAAAQFAHNTMSNLQAGTSNNSCQFWTANTGVQPQQSANFTYRNGQPAYWQTPAAPHQAVSSQQPAGGNQNYLQHSSTNRQSGNYGLAATFGFQQDFHQNSSPNSQSPPNMMKANTTYPQQDMSAHLNQSVHWKHSVRTQGGSSNHQHWVDQSRPPYQYTTTATSPPHEKAVYTAHNRQTAHNHNHRQNGAQHGFSPSIPPPSYDMAVSQSFRNNSITTNSPSSGQNSQVSSTSQQTQQYSVHNSGGEATSSINSYSSQYETSPSSSKTNDLPLHPAVDTQQDMVRRKMIATIANHLRKSATAVLDGRAPACTSLKQLIRDSMREFNQNMQPVTSTVAESYNSNVSQSLPKTTQSFMSTQHSVDVQPQQTPVPDVFYVKTTGDGSKAANESISPTRNHTVPNNHEKPEILEMLLSGKANDSSINSSPGRTRAVAVVQPLTHESYQVASRLTCSTTISLLSEGTAADTSLSNPEKSCISPENQKVRSAASKDGVSSSTPTGLQTLLKLLRADDSGSEPTVKDQRVEQSIPSKVPVSQSSDKDKSEMPTDPKGVLELSSLPTTPWTIDALTKLIQDGEKIQMELEIKDSTKFNSFNKILRMFWNGKLYNVNYNPKLSWYTDLMTDVVKICKDVTPDTVILSKVKHGFVKQLKNCYSLNDKEVYSEQPYKSSWLNVNEQLDDIDKEFDFPWSLKHRLHAFQSDSQPDQVETEYAQVSPTEVEPVDSSEENSTVETASTQIASPLEMETADSEDPYYSFEIQVLPPEEAKIIFAQEQSNQPQSMDNQPERVTDSSVEPSKVMDDTLSDTTLENEPVSPLEQFCCIARWKEMISNTASLSKCQCKNKQGQEDVTEGDNEAKSGENVDDQFMSLGLPELCNELNHTTTKDDDKPHSYSDEEQDNISHISINSSQSCIILIDDDENDLPSSENEIPNQMPKVESDSEVKSTGNMQSCTLVSSDKEIEIGQAQLTSTNVAELSLETEEQQIHATGALQTTGSGKHEPVERKKKRQSVPSLFFPVFNESKKRKSLVDVDSQPVLEGPSKRGKLFVDATDCELSASSVRTVELVLFGSKPQDTCVSFGSRNSHISSPQAVSQRPPKVLTVNLSPLRIMSSETVPAGDYSVKRRLHEKWRRSLPPTKIRKLKTQKCTFASLSGWSSKKAETVVPANTDKLPVSSGLKNGNTRLCLSLKRRRSFKHKEEKRKKHSDPLDQPADQERSEAENGGHADAPLQNKDILKFSVLPNTFNFKDGSNGREETNDPAPGKY